ncbi:MAG: TatD family hydrolase [Parachlamydiales bacterium]
MFTDSHAHLTDPAFHDDIDAVLQRAEEAGVTTILNICTGEEPLRRGLELKRRYPWIHNIAATTPHDADEADPFFSMVAQADLVAIGETGLDYYYEHSPKEKQRALFCRYLTLALERDLPVVIHCREAFDDFFAIIDEMAVKRGVLHCFTGTLRDAEKLMERGWYLSLSGILTFNKSGPLREVAREMPTGRLLIETDAPYLAPQGFRGKRCEPAHVVRVAEELAKVKGLSLQEIAHQTTANVKALFRI